MILIQHGSGGVAEDIARGLAKAGREAAIDHEVDPTSMRAVRAAVEKHRPEAVVIASAWDDPDGCESDPDRAFTRNAEAVIHVAAACLEFQAIPILLSTAEVYGQRGGPWTESDEPSPLSVWTQSRFRGEQFLARAFKGAVILRLGPIVTATLERERTRFRDGSIAEADDELVSPIFAGEIGQVIHDLLNAKAGGVFHVAAREPPISRAGLLKAIAPFAGEAEGSVRPISGRQILRKAARARSATLLPEKVHRHLSRPILPWREALMACEHQPEQPGSVEPQERKMGHRQEVRRVEKPWGYEIIYARTERYVGKLLFLKAGERLSLQYHEKKDETVYVLSGKMVFEVGPKDGAREDLIMKPGDSYRITPFTTHRMIALEDTQILEASTSELDDVVRLEDKYGRAGTNAP